MTKESNIGLSKENLNRLAGAIQKDVEANKYNGGVILVARHGKIGLHQAVGFADRSANRPCRLDDVFRTMSVVKAFVDVVLLKQIERGDLSLITRINDVIPEFKGGFKGQVTVFHLLTHSSGAPEVDFTLIDDTKNIAEAFIAMGLVSAPGSRTAYSSIWGHAILEEVIRRVDGGKRSIQDIFQDELFGPLNMKDSAFGLRKDLLDRLVPLSIFGDRRVMPPEQAEKVNRAAKENPDVNAPGGALSTAYDIFRFAEMLRQGGELDGVRLLSPATVAMALRQHTKTEGNEGLPLFADEAWPPVPTHLGLDIVVRGNDAGAPSAMGSIVSPETFGKFGAGSTGFWVDPKWDVTFVFLSAGMLDEYQNFLRFHRLSDMAMSAVI